MGSDEQAVREAHAAWIAAVNAGDLEQLLGAMAPDVVFVAPGEDPNGRDEFRARFSGAHDEYRIHCVSELDDVVVVGEVAYTLARDSLSVTPRSGGEATTVSGHRLSIYRKQSDGRWLLARDIHTLVPGAE